jgi:translation initiation factor IF-3
LIIPKGPRVNREILTKEVRLILENGKNMGIMPIEEALKISDRSGLDLVEVAPDANPPVCRIMSYGKYKYDRQKKARAARKHQKEVQVKEVNLRPKTEEHDYQFKARHARRFLEKKDKVKVSVLFRGREIVHKELGKQMLNRLAEELSEIALIEKPPTLVNDKRMVMVLAPKAK